MDHAAAATTAGHAAAAALVTRLRRARALADERGAPPHLAVAHALGAVARADDALADAPARALQAVWSLSVGHRDALPCCAADAARAQSLTAALSRFQRAADFMVPASFYVAVSARGGLEGGAVVAAALALMGDHAATPRSALVETMAVTLTGALGEDPLFAEHGDAVWAHLAATMRPEAVVSETLAAVLRLHAGYHLFDAAGDHAPWPPPHFARASCALALRLRALEPRAFEEAAFGHAALAVLQGDAAAAAAAPWFRALCVAGDGGAVQRAVRRAALDCLQTAAPGPAGRPQRAAAVRFAAAALPSAIDDLAQLAREAKEADARSAAAAALGALLRAARELGVPDAPAARGALVEAAERDGTVAVRAAALKALADAALPDGGDDDDGENDELPTQLRSGTVDALTCLAGRLVDAAKGVSGAAAAAVDELGVERAAAWLGPAGRRAVAELLLDVAAGEYPGCTEEAAAVAGRWLAEIATWET